VEEYVCCSNHLTSFTVGRNMDVSSGHPQNAMRPLIFIWVFIVVTMILGFALDMKKACTVDKASQPREVKLPEASGAAAAENADAEVAQNPPDKG